MRDKKLHAVVAQSTFPSQNAQNTLASEYFWKLRCQKSARSCARSTFASEKAKKTSRSDHFWTFRCRFAWQAQGIVHLVQNCAKREGFVACPKTMAGVGHLKKICKNAFRVAGAVQKTCSSEMLGGQGTDLLRGVAFWSIRSVGLLR